MVRLGSKSAGLRRRKSSGGDGDAVWIDLAVLGIGIALTAYYVMRKNAENPPQ